MSAALVLTLLAGMDSAAAPASPEIARMNRTFERAKEVRVVTAAQTFEVSRPHAGNEGLDWRSSADAPLRRPSIAPEDTRPLEEPPRPIPWSSIERIEWRRGGTGTGVIAGVVGAAAIFTGVAILINRSGSDVAPSLLGIGLGSLGGGAVIGVIAAGRAARTEVVYPRGFR